MNLQETKNTTTSTTLRHAVSMAPKNWDLTECSETRLLMSILPGIEQTATVFPGGEKIISGQKI